MSIFKCKMCGGTLEIQNNATVVVCEYCGTRQTLPRLDDERRANLYDRANHFRRNNDFDKAAGIYEQILTEDKTDAEAYWSLVLCRYGIEYVEDPSTHKRVPTVNRAQFTSIFDDDNYRSALQYADDAQRALYEEEANIINGIQRSILAISQKEEPFDVFICYKETDANGRRTPDSVLATELYHELINDGYKVFFSRITLEDKLGQEYEPYIFAALNSAGVMVVVGTRAEYFNAVWVKNEWSRYLALIKNGARKTLIPAYRDMDPYDLPEEFSHLQAQDMSKLGFMQDLLRGIKKILGVDEPKVVTTTVIQETAAPSVAANVAPLLKRMFFFLEDGEWDRADDFSEQVLNQDPECAEAYLGKLMVSLKVGKREALGRCADTFEENNHYKKAIRFGNESLQRELRGYIDSIAQRKENERLQKIYDGIVAEMASANSEEQFKALAGWFGEIDFFRDAAAKRDECLLRAEEYYKERIYAQAKKVAASAGTVEAYERAIALWKSILPWRDSEEQLGACREQIEQILAEQERIRQEEERRRQEQERKRQEELERRKQKEEARLAEKRRKEEARIAEKRRREEQRIAEKRRREEQHLLVIEQRKIEKEEKKLEKERKKALQEQQLIEAMALAMQEEEKEAEEETETEETTEEVVASEKKRKKTPMIIGICAVAAIVLGLGVAVSTGLFSSNVSQDDMQTDIPIDAPADETPFVAELAVGDHFYYGSYEQDGDEINGAEKVEWRVLDRQGDKVLAISEYALAEHAMDSDYNDSDITWETSEGRTWMNGEFFDALFSDEEQEKVLLSTVTADENPWQPEVNQGNDTEDYLFPLSVKEAEKYFSSADDRASKATVAILPAGVSETEPFYVNPWLRTKTERDLSDAPYAQGPINCSTFATMPEVDIPVFDATVAGKGCFNAFEIRPAMWLDLTDNTMIEKIVDLDVGDHFYYGAYEQDGDETNGTEKVEWRVLDRQGDKVLVTSEYALDKRALDPIHENPSLTWETCEARAWMNSEFYDALFDEGEQSKVLLSSVPADTNSYCPDVVQGNDTEDYLFLLSINEAETYFESSVERECKYTPMLRHENNPYAACWLRTKGLFQGQMPDAEKYSCFARTESSDTYYVDLGDICYGWGSIHPLGIRPAMWLDLTENTMIEKIEIFIPKVGDHLYYGSYEQDGIESNGVEPVEWRVLDKQDNKVLVISEYVLEKHAIDLREGDKSITWETCEARAWMNGEFYNTLFSSEEKEKVILSTVTADTNPYCPNVTQGSDTEDYLFLLSVKEAETYFDSASERLTRSTPAEQKKNGSSYQGVAASWLRSRGIGVGYNREKLCFSFISTDTFDPGDCSVFSYPTGYGDIRPAMWLDLTDNTMIKKVETQEISLGDHIYFGRYLQRGAYVYNRPEPVEWRVLDVQGDKALVISEYAIEKHAMDSDYNDPDITWETSEARAWMNGEFFDELFSDKEKEKVILSTVTADENPWQPEVNQGNDTEDYLFPLSVKEAEKYFSSADDRASKATVAILPDGVSETEPFYVDPWLRTKTKRDFSNVPYAQGPIITASTFATMSEVDIPTFDATVTGKGCYNDFSIRPAMWIDLKDNNLIWKIGA